MVCDSGPDSVEYRDDEAPQELLADSADEIREEDGDIVSGKIALPICQMRSNDLGYGYLLLLKQ